jgi:hypothetical protein
MMELIKKQHTSKQKRESFFSSFWAPSSYILAAPREEACFFQTTKVSRTKSIITTPALLPFNIYRFDRLPV